MRLSSVKFYLKVLLSFKSLQLMINSLRWYVKDYLSAHSQLIKGESSFVHPSVNLKSPENVQIGSCVRIQPGVFLWASPNSKIVIGDNSGVGPGTKFFSSNHDYEIGELYIKQPWIEKDIVVEKNVWIGSNCTVLSGVTICEGSVIAAGSVVSRDVPKNAVFAGVPAKRILTKRAESVF